MATKLILIAVPCPVSGNLQQSVWTLAYPVYPYNVQLPIPCLSVATDGPSRICFAFWRRFEVRLSKLYLTV